MADTSNAPSVTLPPGLAGWYRGNSYKAAIQGSTSATWALAFIAVMLRFTARRLSKAGFWYDDWTIIPALVGFESPIYLLFPR